MIKKTKKFIVLAVMMTLGLGLYAQESNLYQVTFGEIINDADKFLDVGDWKDVNTDLKTAFLFSRLGANTNNGILDLGAALKAGNLYLGLYYAGDVTAAYDQAGASAKVDIGNDQKITGSYNNKDNPKAIYTLFVGTGGLGLKFSFEDKLQLTGSESSGVYTQASSGDLIPTFVVSGSGPLTYFQLAVPFHYNRTVVTTAAGTGYTHTASSADASGNPVTATVGSSSYSSFFAIKNEDTNHFAIQPKIALSFGSFKLDEELVIPVFGVATKTEANKGGLIPGVGSSTTTYDSDGAVDDTYFAIWDSRFAIKNILTPKYNISSEAGKVNFSLTGALPFELELTTHSAQGKAVNIGGTETIESKGFVTGSDFGLGIAPEITAGVQFKPVDFFSLQAGLKLELFTLKGTFTGRKTKGLDGDDALHAGGFGWVGTTDDVKTNSSTSEFKYPSAAYSLGFTFNIKAVALDFAFVQELNPAITSGIYEGVAATLGGPDASIVLTAKF
jgi:hypothetical protein